MTDWIEWNGGTDAPVSDDTVIRVVFRDGGWSNNVLPASIFRGYWGHKNNDDDIVKYRIMERN